MTCDRERLIALLQTLDLPAYESVLTLEHELGGFQGAWLWFGAYRMLRRAEEHAHWAYRLDAAGLPLVLVGRDAGNMLYMDEAGTLFGQSLGPHGVLRPRAESAVSWLEKAALLHGAMDVARFPFRCELRGRFGAAIADVIGATPDTDASDAVEPLWSAESLILGEGHVHERPQEPSANQTTLFAANVAVVAECLRAVAAVHSAVEARVMARPTTTHVFPEEAATPPPETGEYVQLAYWSRMARERGHLRVRSVGKAASIEQVLLCGERLFEVTRFAEGVGSRQSFTAAATALVGLCSDRAIAFLKHIEGSIDPRERLSSAALATLLARHGLPPYEPALAFEERFGGLEFVWNDDYGFGIAWQLEGSPPRAPERIDSRIVIPIGQHGDYSYFMDERGRIHERHWDETARCVADSLPDLLDDLSERASFTRDEPESEG